jgi:predicted metal-dependent enzyme (double-stranded beta helix superfamily)
MAQPQLRPTAEPATFTRSIGAIGALAAEIGDACSDPSAIDAPRIKAALRRAVATPGLLGLEQRAATAGCYARHVIYADPSGRFTILAIVWGTGQFSAPHAHHTWCAYAVYENALDETIFNWDAATSTAHPLRTHEREPGFACYAGPGLDQIHRLGNAGTAPAISIHVYGVERDSIGTRVNRMVETTTAA